MKIQEKSEERMSASVKSFMENVKKNHPNQPEFHQAAEEVIESIWPVVERNPKYQKANILDRIIEPERIIMFRVPWMDDRGEVHVNRGYRVEYNSAIGPYKGGLRLHPSVNLSILKFLGFEQIFKNSLTTLPMGGGKGGADFDPKGKSDNEVMRFCQSFMSELWRHIGADTDVPAGDIGVGGREIGFMFGQFKKLKNTFEGVLTGKGLKWGGSLIRPEATGYGCVYFVEEMLKTKNDSFKGKRVVISGSGNVAQYAAEKVIALGGKALTFSDSDGYIVDDEGINTEKLHFVMDLKNNKRGRIKEYTSKFKSAKYHECKEGTVWHVPCDVALPCATQNELDDKDAEALVKNKCKAVGEGANMPTTPKGAEILQKGGVLFGPGKAANAGGVSVSGLEMSQNSLRLSWTREEVDKRLHDIMKSIHTACVEAAKEYNVPGDYIKGANIAGFIKVADAMLDRGLI